MISSFLSACGSNGPLELSIRGPSPHESGVRLLHQPFAIIGRDPRSDIILDHKLVSRRHVYLQIIDGQLFWLDFDSRAGTWTDGQPQRFGWLAPGKAIRIARFDIHRIKGKEHLSEARDSDLESRPSPFHARSYRDQSLPEVTLEFLNGPSQSTCWPMNRVMSLVGAAEGNKFRLADPSVSPFHCSLLRTPLGLWVIDLFGQGGVAINDATVRFGMLADGDVLKVGKYRIRVKSRFAPLAPGMPPQRDRGYGWSAPSSLPRPRPQAPTPARLDASRGETFLPGPIAWTNVTASDPTPMLHAGSPDIRAWTAPEPAVPAVLEDGELGRSVLVPLVNQFGSMQQQMLDQFQQAIAMLVQMFGTMHRDQMNVIREELDQLRDLTKELHELKQELVARSQEQPVAQTAAPREAPLDSEAAPIPDRIEAPPEPKTQASTSPVAGAAEPPPIPSPQPAAAREAAAQDRGAAARAERQASEKAEAGPSPDPAAAAARASAAGPERDANRDVMLWLHERMITLQQERETRWQKILKLLPGIS